MSFVGSNILAGASGQGGGDYTIERSVRFNASDSSYLSRAPSSAGNRRTWTWSCWIKRNTLDSAQNIFVGSDNPTKNNTTHSAFYFHPSNKIYFGGWSSYYIATDAVYRDVSAWYHIVLSVDTSQSTATDRIKVYVNNVLQSYGTGGGFPGQNTDLGINQAHPHYIGGNDPQSGYASHMYAEVNFVDGSAIDPTSFGEFDTNGVWQAIKYAGTYGTNGFRLKFADNSGATATTLGKDTSGNSNNWTPNNLSVTAGVGNDSLVDTPTNGTASSGGDAGGVTVGNYATLNPLFNSSGTYTEGNLQLLTTAGNRHYQATLGLTSGKWYWEIEPDAGASVGMIGIALGSKSPTANLNGDSAMSYYGVSGYKQGGNTSGVDAAYGATFTYGDIIGVALDLDSGTKTLTFYKNGVGQGVAFNPDVSLGAWFPAVSSGSSVNTTTFIANFGQRAFAYAAPSGYKSLNTANLPEPTIADGSDHFQARTRVGGGTTQTFTTLSPGLVWQKNRTDSGNHYIYDVVRGDDKYIDSQSTAAEASGTGAMAFSANSYAVASSFDWPNTKNIIDWVWDAGTSTVTNNDGSIASQVRAQPSAGFSICTYTGAGSGSANSDSGESFGHGLNTKPELVIAKKRSGVNGWPVYHGSTALGALSLNSTVALDTSSFLFAKKHPSSSVVYLGNNPEINASGSTYVAYCFAPVSGYSAMGSYTGNGSADGPFVYTGFKPAFLLVKAFTSGSAEHWYILDSVRNTSNVVDKTLFPSLSNAEDTDSANNFDFLSNGFKLRNTNAGFNYSGRGYLYYAVAENPFKTARAR